jgi:hypothetical protein
LAALAFNLLSSGVALYAQETPPRSTPWPAEVWRRIEDTFNRNQLEKAGIAIENAIFDEIENVKVSSRILPILKTDFRLGRNIYNNWDPRGQPKDGLSWSVVDRLGMSAHFTAINYPIPVPGTALTFSFNIGSEFGADFYHIRQVFDWSLKTQQELQQDIDDIEAEQLELVELESMDVKTQFPFDIAKLKRKARRKLIMNMVAHPFRFPFSAKRLKKMKVGDIYAYNARGVISVGAGLTVAPYNLDLTQLNASATASTYLGGSFRTSIYKFDKNKIRLKITNIAESGFSMAIGSNNRATYLRGFFLFKNEKSPGIEVPNQTVEFIPFTLSYANTPKELKEFVYDFDLTHPDAITAIEQALKGNLDMANFMSHENQEVKKVYDKSESIDLRSTTQRMKLLWFLETKHEKNKQKRQYKLVFPDGRESEIFESERKGTIESKNDLAYRELQSFSAIASIDQSCIREGKEDCFQLQTNYMLLDSNTKFREMRSMIDMAESVLQTDIFPDYHEEFEEVTGKEVSKKKFFWGRSEMQLGQILNQKQMEEFFSFHPDFMWGLISETFHPKGITAAWDTNQERLWYEIYQIPDHLWAFALTPLVPWKEEGKELVASKRFFKQWKKLREKFRQDPIGFFRDTKNITNISKLFNAPKFANELMTLLRKTLKNNRPYTFLDLTSTSIGTARIQQKNPSVLNQNIIKNDEITNYDIFPRTLFFRPTLQIRTFLYNELGKYFDLDFGIKDDLSPQYLQFELRKLVGRNIPGIPRKTKQVGPTIFYENSAGKFQNKTQISMEELKNLPGLTELLDMIDQNNDFYLAMSYSMNKSDWSHKEEVLIYRKP